MKQLIASLFVFSAILLRAQTVNEAAFVRDSAQKNQISFSSNAYFLSGDLNREFTSKFTRGGFIDSTLKKNILDDLREKNRFGAELRSEISYYAYRTNAFGRPDWGYFAGIGTHEYYGAEFGKNIFELTFFGNRGFSGDTVALAPFSLNAIAFSKLGFGVFNKENHSKISLSLVAGHRFTDLHINRADLYTAGNGSELSLALNENMQRSDSSNNGNAAINGYGLCTDIVFNLNSGKNRSVRFPQAFRVALENFGFIRWSDQSLSQKKDSVYRYTGFEITDLFNEGYEPFSTDDISDTLGLQSTKEQITTWLPFTFSIAATTETFSVKKIQSFYGLRMRAFIHYKPMVYLGVQYNPVSNLALSAYGAFGGYGGFRAGFSCAARIGNSIRFSLASGNLAGWFSKSAYGQDISLTFSALF